MPAFRRPTVASRRTVARRPPSGCAARAERDLDHWRIDPRALDSLSIDHLNTLNGELPGDEGRAVRSRRTWARRSPAPCASNRSTFSPRRTATCRSCRAERPVHRRHVTASAGAARRRHDAHPRARAYACPPRAGRRSAVAAVARAAGRVAGAPGRRRTRHPGPVRRRRRHHRSPRTRTRRSERFAHGRSARRLVHGSPEWRLAGTSVISPIRMR